MNYEEKYKEIVGQLKKAYLYAQTDSTKAVLEEIYPELSESEDEKVIKEIIELVMQPTWKTEEEFHRRNVLCAWLENVPVTIDHEKREGFHLGYKACLEKQGEKKPEENKGNLGRISPNSEWSEEDVFRTETLISVIKSGGSIRPELRNEFVNWLQSLKDRVLSQPKQEWSDDDKRKIDRIYSILRQAADTHAFSTSCRLIGDKECMELQDWLKSLRPQNTYNPYKAVVESIAEMCKHYDKASHSGLRDFYDNVKVKSKEAQEYDKMFPQAQWKPTDEQMGCLSDAIEHYNSLGYPAPKLKELLDDLKKLKEGDV